ncbi:MAG: hypothetical protein Q9160_003702 [Pyrenula sp. 1 TL-2023]
MSSGTPSLASLLSKAALTDHEEILKVANATLKKLKQDTEAQHARVVALLKLDRYEDAVRAVEEGGDNLKAAAGLEYSYALYKVGKLVEAKTVARTLKGRAARFVEAQALYREEEFENVRRIYQELLQDKAASEQADMRINMGAVEAQLLWQDTSNEVEDLRRKKVERADLDAFETAFNAACGCIAKADLRQAEVLLKRAKELCKHSEDLSNLEKEAELLPITVQQLYVLLKLGKIKEAEDIASEIEVTRISDLSTRQIAENNLIAGPNKPSNPFLIHRSVNSTRQPPSSDALFHFQSRPLSSNRYTADLLASKHKGVARSTATAVQAASLPSIDPSITTQSVFNAAAHARDSEPKAAIRKIQPEFQKRPKDIGLLLTLIQLHAQTNNYPSATQLLESFLESSEFEIRYNPGLVAVLTALYKAQNRSTAIRSHLTSAANYWLKQPNDIPQSLFLAAGSTLLTSASPSSSTTAQFIFSALYASNTTSPSFRAGYIASHAFSSPPTNVTPDLLATLPPVSPQISHIDVSKLLAQGIPNPATSAAKTASLKRKAGADKSGGVQKKKKRVRKSRLPKDYVEGREPDPERWLPLRERSGFRPKKGKKGGKKGGGEGGMQGGMGAADVGGAGGGAAAAGGGGGGGGGKKKKGKGKK